jgi:hypothetical protein
VLYGSLLTTEKPGRIKERIPRLSNPPPLREMSKTIQLSLSNLIDKDSHGKVGCCAVHRSMEWHTRGGWGLGEEKLRR